MSVETKPRTVQEWLQDLSTSNTSTEQDSAKMQAVLRKVGFPSAVVVMGIVYLEGKGTMDCPPTSIHSIAKMLVKELGI
jgi:hypothetical protein